MPSYTWSGKLSDFNPSVEAFGGGGLGTGFWCLTCLGMGDMMDHSVTNSW